MPLQFDWTLFPRAVPLLKIDRRIGDYGRHVSKEPNMRCDTEVIVLNKVIEATFGAFLRRSGKELRTKARPPDDTRLGH
jgi:hypothetical protein